MKTSIYRIAGMHCEGCARTVEALVGQVLGVQRVAVSFQAREARVLFDPAAVAETAIVAAIERAGFRMIAPAP